MRRRLAERIGRPKALDLVILSELITVEQFPILPVCALLIAASSTHGIMRPGGWTTWAIQLLWPHAWTRKSGLDLTSKGSLLQGAPP